MTYINTDKANTITVAKRGGHFLTLKEALVAATAGDAIRLSPGVYMEDPFVIPANVTIKGNKATLVATDNSADFATLGNGSAIHNLTLSGPTAGNTTSLSGGVGALAVIENCIFVSAAAGTNVAVRCDGAGNQIIIEESKFYTNVYKGLHANNNGRIDGSSILGYASHYTHAENDGVIWVHNVGCLGSQVAIRAESGGKVLPHNFTAEGCGVVMSCDGATSVIEGLCVYGRDTVNLDVLQANGGHIEVLSAFANQEKFSIEDPEEVHLVTSNEIDGDESLLMTKNLVVGTGELGKISRLGSGDTTARGMMVYTYNASTTAFTDVTDIARSPLGSTFSFPGVSVNNAVYVATTIYNKEDSDYKQWPGLRALLTVGGVLGATGEIVSEYYNGTSWIELNTMSIEGGAEKLPHPKEEIFLRAGKEDINNDISMGDTWAKNDPPTLGTNYYWIRYRISTAITTAPVFQQMAIHMHHTKVNKDGWVEYRGNARCIKSLNWDIGLLEPATASPGNQDLFISDTLAVGAKENQFNDGATDRSGFNTFLPLDTDTSSGITLRWSFSCTDDTLGDIDWVVRWGFTNSMSGAQSLIYPTTSAAPTTGPNEQSLSLTKAAEGVQYKQIDMRATLDISGMTPKRASGGQGDMLWVTIQRTGSDTYAGNVALTNINGYYYAWCNGGHR